MRRSTSFSNSSAASPMLWTGRGLEAMWLLTVALAPLVYFSGGQVLSSPAVLLLETPKIVLLRSLAGLMAILWLLEWVLQVRMASPVKAGQADQPKGGPRAWLSGRWRWLRRQPSRWVIVAVWFYSATVILSTCLSTSFSVSLWGEVPGQDSSATYTVMAYLLLFGVLATHLKTRAQLWRLLGAIVAAGALVGGYGVLQHYGAGFLHVSPPEQARVSSITGNPIFAASILLLSISVSLVLATVHLESARSQRVWMNTVLWCAVLTIQVLGIVFTLSRGPWVGTIMAVAGFFVLTALFAGWRTVFRAAGLVGLTAVVVALVVWTTPRIESDESLAGDVAGRFTSIGGDVAGGGLTNRVPIWQTSSRLMLFRPWFAFDSLSLPLLRPLIGYGPDLFRSTHLLESALQEGNMLPMEPLQAHNYLIHQGVELGILGLISSLAIFVAVFLTGGYLLWRQSRSYSQAHKLILAGVMATLGGRFVEQMVGVPRVGDLTITWALLAVFIALPAVMQTPESPVQAPNRRRRSQRGPAPPAIGMTSDNRFLLRLPVAVFLALLLVALTWVKSVNYARAALEGQDVNRAVSQGDLQGALDSLDRIARLAPDVFGYYQNQAEIYSSFRRQGQQNRERECGLSDNGATYEACLARRGYLSNLQAVQQRPYHYRTRAGLADASLSLALLTNDTQINDETFTRYRQLVDTLPQSWAARNELAKAYILLGQPEDALPVLEESLRITDGSDYSSEALALLGVAHRDMGRFPAALRVMDDVIRLDPTPEAYHNRGNVFQDLGQPERALEDLNEALRLDPYYVDAYNSRGFAYISLGRPESAITDLGQAIELDSEYTLAYVNRAKAATLLGDEVAARKDLDQAVSLGYDRDRLEKDLNDLRDTP